MKKTFTWDFPLTVAAGFVLTYGATFVLVVRLPPLPIFITVFFVSLLFTLTAAAKKYMLFALPALGALLLFALPLGLYRFILEFWQEFITWVWAWKPDPDFERITVMLLSVTVMLPVFILIRCHSPALILLLAGGTLFVGLEAAGFDYPSWLLWAFLLIVLLLTAYNSAKKPSGMRLAAALPLCLVIVIAAGSVAQNGIEPFAALRDFIKGVGHFGFFSSSSATGSIGGEMGGPFRPAGRLLLKVTAPDCEPPYLRGGMGVTYDGRRWFSEGVTGWEGMDWVSDSSQYGFSGFEEYVITHIALGSEQRYLPYNTFFLFQPDTEGGSLTYTAYAGAAQTTEITQQQRNMYTQTPYTMPTRVRQLARSLAVYEGDYFNALAIEKYLSQNYAYNSDMPRTPGDKDFVDYFLFEQNEGYCTYFASAMVMLCRSANIPARYVSGFAPGADYNYTDEQSHAWCEVYLDGIWTQFEPTPGYARTSYPAFPEPVRAEPSPTPSARPSPSPYEPEQPAPSFVPQNGAQNGVGDDGTPDAVGRVVPYAVLILLLLCALHFSLWLRRRLFVRMLGTMPYTQAQTKRIYRHVLWLVSHLHVSPSPEESLWDFARRADEAWPAKLFSLSRIADVYGKTCYAQSPLTLEECKVLRYYIKVLEQREVINLGKWRYRLYKRVLFLL